MAKAVVEALASSTAHGISRVASVKSIPMKIMWALLFIVFLGLFLKSGVNLVVKLRQHTLSKSFELDKVSFVFPDLYLCPSNPYSGSYPFDLSAANGKAINDEISRLNGLLEDRYPDLRERVRRIQGSLPVGLSMQHLAQQTRQAIQQFTVTPSLSGPSPQFLSRSRVVAFSHPENMVCFYLQLDQRARERIATENWQINLRLSTDPFFDDFNYTGSAVEPIKSKATGRQLPFQDWSYRYGSETLQDSGFVMLIVPPGAYPSLVHETKFYLAPGNGYTVALAMEETEFSEELHNSHCYAGNRKSAFKDHQTGDRAEFEYSYAACYYTETVDYVMRRNGGCLFANYPIEWSLGATPRCMNLSEASQEIVDLAQDFLRKNQWSSIDKVVREKCRKLQPCRYRKYSASFSFCRWPGISSVVRHFAAMSDQFATPAQRQLIRMAKSISADSANHSAGSSESAFRTYISESFINVVILAQSSTSSQVVISAAYSLTAFLADTGGLLGLYIGCSLLTLCELLELFYQLLSDSVSGRKAKNEASKNDEAADMEQQSQQQQQQNEPVAADGVEEV